MKPILTPDFALPSDGWYHAMPLGEFPNTLLVAGADGGVNRRRVVQICDRDSALAMVEAFNRAAAAPDFPGLLIDRDHESDDPEKTTDAWGWVTALENREDGLYARIRWTDLGQPAVAGGRFRFLSPVFDPDLCQDLGNGRIRPVRLEKLGLTNDPNMKALRPLTNRVPAADAAPAPADSGKHSPGSSGRKESTMDFKAELLAMLGLSADASDEAIAAAIKAAKEAAGKAPTPEALEQMTNRAQSAEAALAALRTEKLTAQVESDLEAHKDVIANRDEVKAALLANRESTLKVLAALRKPVVEDPPPALRNRSTRAPASAALSNRAREQQGLVNSIRDRERNAGRTCSFDRAWEMAKAEKPELFREEQK